MLFTNQCLPFLPFPPPRGVLALFCRRTVYTAFPSQQGAERKSPRYEQWSFLFFLLKSCPVLKDPPLDGYHLRFFILGLPIPVPRTPPPPPPPPPHPPFQNPTTPPPHIQHTHAAPLHSSAFSLSARRFFFLARSSGHTIQPSLGGGFPFFLRTFRTA